MTNPIEKTEYSFSSDSVYLYFLGGFSKDTIKIECAGVHFKLDGVTTDEALGVAIVEKMPIFKGDSIRIKKLNTLYDLYIPITDTSYKQIGIWFDHDRNKMRFILNKEPFRFE